MLLRGAGGTSAAVRGDITLFVSCLDTAISRIVLSFSFHSLTPQLSVPCGRGRDGRGMRRLFGLASRVSETGQRRTEPHSATSRTLDCFLELEERSKMIYSYTLAHDRKYAEMHVDRDDKSLPLLVRPPRPVYQY